MVGFLPIVNCETLSSLKSLSVLKNWLKLGTCNHTKAQEIGLNDHYLCSYLKGEDNIYIKDVSTCLKMKLWMIINAWRNHCYTIEQKKTRNNWFYMNKQIA